jgi:hypothetical protein
LDFDGFALRAHAQTTFAQHHSIVRITFRREFLRQLVFEELERLYKITDRLCEMMAHLKSSLLSIERATDAAERAYAPTTKILGFVGFVRKLSAFESNVSSRRFARANVQQKKEDVGYVAPETFSSERFLYEIRQYAK